MATKCDKTVKVSNLSPNYLSNFPIQEANNG